MGLCRMVYFMIFFLIGSVLCDSIQLRDRNEMSSFISLLLALDPSLARLLVKAPVFYSIAFTPYSANQLFTQSYYTLQIQSDTDNMVLTYLALNSTEYKLTQTPLLYHTQQSPLSLEVIFTPLHTGIRTAYLLVATETDLFIYYFQGISVETPYNFHHTYLEYFQGETGAGVVKFHNPLDRNTIVHVRPDQSNTYLIYGLEQFVIPPDSEGEFSFVSLAEIPGEYQFQIILVVEEVRYYVPVFVTVRAREFKCTQSIDIGLLTKTDFWFSVNVTCSNSMESPVELTRVATDSIDTRFVLSTKIVQAHRNDIIIGRLGVRAREQGVFCGSIRVFTRFASYKIHYTYRAVLDLLEYSAESLYFSSNHASKKKITIKNTLVHDIWIDKVQQSHNFTDLLTPTLVIRANDTSDLYVSVSPAPVSNAFFTLLSNIGKIMIPIFLIDPYIVFFSNKGKKPAEIYGPLDLGCIGQGNLVTSKIGIKNPNDFEVQIYSIQDLSSSSLKYTENLFMTPLGYFEFLISIRPEVTVFEPIHISTSIGIFSLSVYLKVLTGQCKFKPIYISELFPRVPREEYIYLANTYAVPVKIISISSSLDFLTISKTRDTVGPDKDQIIGKATLLYTKQEKPKIDFKKVLTYGDARIWNQISRNAEVGEKIGEIKVLTDIAGEIKTQIHINLKKGRLTIETQSKFSICKIFDTCIFNVRVHNPLKIPVVVQLLVAPQYFIADLHKFDCSKQYKYNEYIDDEFEGITPENSHIGNAECLSKHNDEISVIKISNEKKPSTYVKSIQEPNIFERFASILYGEALQDSRYHNSNLYDDQCKNIGELQEDWAINQYLFLGEKIVNIIPPESSKLLGPIIFQPSRTGIHNLSLILRNNYTIIETHSIRASVGFNKLAIMKRNSYSYINGEYMFMSTSIKKESSRLMFDISTEEITKFTANNKPIVNPIIFRTFELQNLGNIDAEIRSITLDDQVCEKNGYRLNNCRQEFLLKPQESIIVEISYYLFQSQLKEKVNLMVFTRDEVLYFPIESNASEDLQINNYIYTWAEEGIILSLGFYISLFFLILRENLLIKNSFCRAKSTKDIHDLVIFKYFCRKYSQPIYFSSQETPIQPEPEVKQTPQVVEPEIVQVAKGKKKFKVKRNLDNLVQKAETGKKNGKLPAVVPEIIATNKFLLEKKKKLMDTNNKDPLPQVIEKPAENDDDFYIDSYKTSNILFGRLSDRESISLAELTQDSDPLD